LYRLLLQKDATLLVISDNGAIIENLSALPTNLPLQKVAANHLASDALIKLRAAAKPTEHHPLLACRIYLLDCPYRSASSKEPLLATELILVLRRRGVWGSF
jgi:hypothetical protein